MEHEEAQQDSEDGALLCQLRDIVEGEMRAVEMRLRSAERSNRAFFDQAAAQIQTHSDTRKLLKLVRNKRRVMTSSRY